MSYILTLDIGTTNIKAFLFDKNGDIFGQAKRRPNYILDNPGQVEQDPKEIWELSKEVIEEVIKSNNLKADQIDSLAITSYRSSFLFWDKNTGEPKTNINTWQDKRAAAYVERHNKKFMFRALRAITKFFYLTTRSKKMRLVSWLKFTTDHPSIRTGYFLKTNPEFKKLINQPKSSIVWGPVDSWILFNLTERKIFATDYSNASATGLIDPFTSDWNFLTKHFKIPKHILPDIRDTRGDFGITTLFGGGEIPIRAVIGDQMGSLFGQCCFNKGDLKVSNGTGSFTDLNAGNKVVLPKGRLYPLIAWKVGEEIVYLTEGTNHNCANIIDWIQTELNFFQKPEETEDLALSVDSTNGVFFLPTFTTGISYPYWDPTARGNIFGLSLDTKKAHIVRAVLEGLCFRIKDVVEGIIRGTDFTFNKIKADGGVSQNKFILQFLSDILGIDVEHSGNPETTALGAAFMAGLATGFWKSKEELVKVRKVDKVYTPQMSEEERKKKYYRWKDIISRSLNYEII